MKIHGHDKGNHPEDPLQWYGSDRDQLTLLMKEDPGLSEVLSDRVHLQKVQVVWGARKEMARTVEDILARRTRILQLDAREAIRLAPSVAALLAGELGFGRKWEEKQVEEFTRLAGLYLLSAPPDP
jgi:glycerol-3-phosphate dehydrogenase